MSARAKESGKRNTENANFNYQEIPSLKNFPARSKAWWRYVGVAPPPC